MKVDLTKEELDFIIAWFEAYKNTRAFGISIRHAELRHKLEQVFKQE